MSNKGKFTILHEYDGPAYWQPTPNDGCRVTMKVTDENFNQPSYHAGIHHMQPGGRVPSHHHTDTLEMLFVHRGEATVIVEGDSYVLKPGSLACIGPMVEHEFFNSGNDELVLLWLTDPPNGLVEYLSGIGKKVLENGEPTPPPFTAKHTPNAQLPK